MVARIRFIALIPAVALLVASGCGSTTQADNAAEFRQRAAGSGYDIAYLPPDESRPGIVAGVVRSGDGVRSKFVFSFGPGPDKLPDGFRERPGATWFDRGDRLEYWIQRLPSGLGGAPEGRYVEMIFTLQDVACRVVADRPCLG